MGYIYVLNRQGEPLEADAEVRKDTASCKGEQSQGGEKMAVYGAA